MNLEVTRLCEESNQAHLSRLLGFLEEDKTRVAIADTDWERITSMRALEMTKLLITQCKKRIRDYEIRWQGNELMQN